MIFLNGKKHILLFLFMVVVGTLYLTGCDTVDQFIDECSNYGGVPIITNEAAYCYNATNPDPIFWYSCDPEDIYVSYRIPLSDIYPGSREDGSRLACGYLELPKLTMTEQGICKIKTIENGYLGGTVKITGKGAPTSLRLEKDGNYYLLSVIASSVKFIDYDNAIWEAEFSLNNFSTGQPLAPEGTYNVRCFGSNGTADGGGIKVTIGK